jgi:hypothetical protein
MVRLRMGYRLVYKATAAKITFTLLIFQLQSLDLHITLTKTPITIQHDYPAYINTHRTHHLGPESSSEITEQAQK